MPGVKVVAKAVASKAAKTLGTSSSAEAKSDVAKILAECSVTTRKVHAAPKTGSVSRATAKSAVKKAIRSRSLSGRKK